MIRILSGWILTWEDILDHVPFFLIVFLSPFFSHRSHALVVYPHEQVHKFPLLLLLSASPCSGSPHRDSILHFTPSTSSPSLAPTLFMSSLTKSIQLLLGLPLFLLPGTAISIILFPT